MGELLKSKACWNLQGLDKAIYNLKVQDISSQKTVKNIKHFSDFIIPV